MQPIKRTLCPDCACCPEVEISDAGVTIGEGANSVRLSLAEWDELVRLIKSGELPPIAGKRVAALPAEAAAIADTATAPIIAES